MTTIAETRVLPEELDLTWQRLRAAFRDLHGQEIKGIQKDKETADRS
jgi:hypothetical protein